MKKNILYWNKYQAGIAGFLFFLTFCVYFFTSAPTIVFGDSPELTGAIYTGGVIHPSGYPIYTILGQVFTFLIPGSPAHSTNLYSAFFAALTIVFIYLTCLRIYKKIFLSAIPPLLIAFSSIFWSQAIITEVYSLNAFFTVFLLYLAVCWNDTGRKRYIYLQGLFFGLALAHHILIVFLFPGLIYFFIKSKKSKFLWQKKINWKTLFLMMLLFLIGLSAYLYLPFSASTSPIYNWGNPSTLSNFLMHVTGTESQMAVFNVMAGLSSLSKFLLAFLFEFTFAGALLIIFGFFEFVNKKILRNFLVLAFSFYLIPYFFWNIFDIAFYFIPALIVLSLFIPAGVLRLDFLVKDLMRFSKKTKLIFYSIIIIALPVILFVSNYSYLDRSQDYTAYDRAKNMLDSLPLNALVVAEEVDAQPMSYLQLVEEYRTDIIVISRDSLGKEWYSKQLEARTGMRLPTTEEILVFFDDGYHLERVQEFCGIISTTTCWNITREFLVHWCIQETDANGVFFGFNNQKYVLPGYKLIPSGLVYTYSLSGKVDMIDVEYSFRGFDDGDFLDAYTLYAAEAYFRSFSNTANYLTAIGEEEKAKKFETYSHRFSKFTKLL